MATCELDRLWLVVFVEAGDSSGTRASTSLSPVDVGDSAIGRVSGTVNSNDMPPGSAESDGGWFKVSVVCEECSARWG